MSSVAVVAVAVIAFVVTVPEVARMLSGAKVTDTSLQHAAQMIATSR